MKTQSEILEKSKELLGIARQKLKDFDESGTIKEKEKILGEIDRINANVEAFHWVLGIVKTMEAKQ